MLTLNDERWTTLEGGYRVPVDLRPLLRELEASTDPQSAWDALWQEMYHQGDVGPGSYAAVPHLVRIHRQRGEIDWNTYALVSTVELARGRPNNPDVPDWSRAAYESAVAELARLGLSELPRATSPEAVQAILGLLAIHYGARTHGRLLIEFAEEEVAEMLRESFGE